MKVICCEGGSDLCKDFTCKVEKTDSGFTINFTGDDPEKVKALHQLMGDCCKDSDSGKTSCC